MSYSLVGPRALGAGCFDPNSEITLAGCVCKPGFIEAADGTCITEAQGAQTQAAVLKSLQDACLFTGGTWDAAATICRFPASPQEQAKLACAAHGGTWDPIANTCRLPSAPAKPPAKASAGAGWLGVGLAIAGLGLAGYVLSQRTTSRAQHNTTRNAAKR